MGNKVYAVRCQDYSQVEEKLKELLEPMGGMERFVKSGENILLKPNLLLAAAPKKAVTTHPALVTAVGNMTKSLGASPLVADSPGSGYPHSAKRLNHLYERCGMDKAEADGNISLNYDTTWKAVSFPDGKLIKRIEVITPVLETDGMINLCKLKTHTFMGMTGAVKNIFGIIPGLKKPGYHAKLHDTGCFADMLLDLSAYAVPRLSIMDAVLAMEGNGPSGGEPRQVGLLLAAANPLALDVVAGEIMGLPRDNNPILPAAEKRGLSPTRPEEIELIGMDLRKLRIPDFKLPATFSQGSGLALLPSWITKPIEALCRTGTSLKPRVHKDKCTACGACRDSCPVHVIEIIGGKYALINHKNCIRCYCCHEICQDKAIELRSNLLHRLINRK